MNSNKNKKKSKGQKHPSLDNVHVDSSEVQDLIKAIDDMSPEKIREQIQLMVDEMDLPGNSKDAILNKPLSEQRMLLKSAVYKDRSNEGKGKHLGIVTKNGIFF